MSDIVIRKAIAEDAPLLPALERSAAEAFRTVPGLEWLADDGVMSADHHAVYVDEGTVWVAESGGDIVGFITTRLEFDENSLHIIELSVASDQQGQGLGRKLVQAAIQYALGEDLVGLTLTTFRDLPFNEKFYQKVGFQTLETDALTPRLRVILQEEPENGLPADRRCAMRLELV